MSKVAMKTKASGTHPKTLPTNPIGWALSGSFLVHLRVLLWEGLAARPRNPVRSKKFHVKMHNKLQCCKIEMWNHERIEFLQVNRKKTSSYSRKDVYNFQSRFPANFFLFLISSLWRVSGAQEAISNSRRRMLKNLRIFHDSFQLQNKTCR